MDKLCSILLVDDEEIVHETLGGYLEKLGHRVEYARHGYEGLSCLENGAYDLALVDIRMPRMDGFNLQARAQEICPEMPFVIITGHADMEATLTALRLGAADFLPKPVDLLYLEALLERAQALRLMRQEQSHLRQTIRSLQVSEYQRLDNRRYIGESASAQRVRTQISDAIEAKYDTVLILGETGTGKEVVAREIHFGAESEDRPFIAVSCPALPDALVESELFGHVEGAFTGASGSREGYFELADNGTLFLDEVGDLSPSAQAALLRVLETRSVRRLGGSEEKKVQVRIITATNAPLDEYIKQGKFRSDLFYRLNLFVISLPPLRDRRDDIIPLAEYFLERDAIQRNRSVRVLSPEASNLLLAYPFPGNVRELRTLVERASGLCRSGLILPEHFNLTLRDPDVPPEVEMNERGATKTVILQVLEQTRWNRREAAKALGLSYSAFRRRMQKFGIR